MIVGGGTWYARVSVGACRSQKRVSDALGRESQMAVKCMLFFTAKPSLQPQLPPIYSNRTCMSLDRGLTS